MFMSLEQVAQITDPEKKAMAEALLSLQDKSTRDQARLGALEKNTLEGALKVRRSRIERIIKRNPTLGFKEKIEAQAKDIQLSIGDDGSVHDPFLGTLDLLELGQKDLPELLLSAANVTVEGHPKDFDGSVAPEHAKAIADRLAKLGGHTKS